MPEILPAQHSAYQKLAQDGTGSNYELATTVSSDSTMTGRFADGWKTPMRLKAESSDGKMVYTILSAGEDRKWDTADDLSSADLLKPE